MPNIRHAWKKAYPSPGDKIRRLRPHKDKEIQVGGVYTVKKMNIANELVSLEECNSMYSVNFFEPANIPVSQLVILSEHYQIF